MADDQLEKKKKGGILSNIFYIVILPIIFSLVLIFVVMQIVGIPIVSTIEQLPFLSHYFPQKKIINHVTHSVSALEQKEKLLLLEDKKENKSIIMISNLENKITTLQNQLKLDQIQITHDTKEIQATNKKNMNAALAAQIYNNMSSNAASAVFMLQPFDQEIAILKQMSPSDQSSLLATLPPSLSAKLIENGG